MQQHLSLINKHVNTVKDVAAKDFIQVFAQHLKQINKFKIPDVSAKRPKQPICATSQDVRVRFSLFSRASSN